MNCLRLDEDRRKLLNEVETLKHERNIQSENIGKLMKEGKDTTEIKARMKEISEKIKELDKEVNEKESKLSSTFTHDS